MTYKLIEANGETQAILRLTSNTVIPLATDNRDYQSYLAWVAEGNTPEAADPPPAPGPDYQAFWDALLISPVYQEIRSQAITTPGVLVACTEFIAAVTDAKAGRPNVPAIQACIDNLLAAGSFSTEDLEAIGGLLVVGNLQDSFTLG
jgi:hypothetical protein